MNWGASFCCDVCVILKDSSVHVHNNRINFWKTRWGSCDEGAVAGYGLPAGSCPSVTLTVSGFQKLICNVIYMYTSCFVCDNFCFVGMGMELGLLDHQENYEYSYKILFFILFSFFTSIDMNMKCWEVEI